MKKYIFSFFLLFILLSCTKENQISKSTIEIINLSIDQLSLMDKWQNKNGALRDSTFVNKLYKPHLPLWNNYLGQKEDFIKWLNESAFPELKAYQKREKEINFKELDTYFLRTVKQFEKFTEQKPKGKWYIVFGPKWTDAGGIGNGNMVLDLAKKENNEEHIKITFPHELNHQIYSNTLPSFKSVVLKRIINEGFACYVNYIFQKEKITKAKILNYSEEEYSKCLQSDTFLISTLKKHSTSDNEKIAKLFANRGYIIKEGFPGGIGYYLGFKIIEEFVKQEGKNSWKNVYTMTPEKVLEKSKILY